MDGDAIRALVEMGGNEWKKGDYHRIYFNDLGSRLGLTVTRYNTGNISGARLDGERISNSEAGRILGRLAEIKVWVDVPAQRLMVKNPSVWGAGDDEVETILNSIRRQASEYGVEL